MHILKCNNLTMKFGELTAVDGLSFNVEEKEIFGIAGPNGAGKTTLFNMITGVYKGKGEILFQKKNISKLAAYEVCRVGVARTFQIPQLFDTLSVLQNVVVGAHFGRSKNEKSIEKAAQTLDLIQMHGKEDNKVSNLNLFDKKLTMLAAAMATGPKLLLLDEPIAGLNHKEINQYIEIIRKINREKGLTIIIIEHFMKVLTKLSNRLMIIENGKRLCIDIPEIVVNDRKVIECYLGEAYDCS